MAYFGKEFKVDREENYADFIKSLGLPEAETTKFISYSPTTKIEKDGDTYKSTSTTAEGSKTTTFTSGVELEEEVRPGLKIKSTYTVDGDTITQVITNPADNKSATFKRSYTENELTVTITANFWDGTAYRYYKAL